MVITNNTSDTFIFPGPVVLLPEAELVMADEVYSQKPVRDAVNSLYSDGRISVSEEPSGFPISDVVSGGGASFPEGWRVRDNGSFRMAPTPPFDDGLYFGVVDENSSLQFGIIQTQSGFAIATFGRGLEGSFDVWGSYDNDNDPAFSVNSADLGAITMILPTVDPEYEGQLWSDGSVVKVSAG